MSETGMTHAIETGVDWRSTHQELSADDLRFRELAQEDPALLDRSRFAALEQNKHLLKYRLQPWPTFVGREKLDELKRVSLNVCNLVRSIPSRIFGNDAQKISDFYNLGSPFHVELILAPPNGIATTVSRGDFIDTEKGLQCIEFNFTPNLGGWETTILVGMHRQVPAISAFLDSLRGRWSYTPTTKLFFLHVIEDLKAKKLLERELTVAFIYDPAEGTPIRLPELEQELARACEEAGLHVDGQVVACSYDQIERRDGALFLGGRKVHALTEFCGQVTAAHAFRTFKAGKVALFNGPIDQILSNKLNIALLSEHASSDLFSSEERDVIRNHIPWSCRVFERRVTFHGDEVELADLLANARERLVLKFASSAGGKDVSLGRFTSPAAWSDVVRTAFANGSWIVQEKVESLPYLYQSGADGCSVHDVIWGPFFFGPTYGGMILRMQPKADGGAVNLSLTATEGIVLEV